MNILVKPLITEKSMQDAANNRYTFAVAKSSNKAQIGQQVASTFGVKVLAVKTITVKGTTKRAGRRRMELMTSPWKKAIVEIERGKKIDLFDVAESPRQTVPAASAK